MTQPRSPARATANAGSRSQYWVLFVLALVVLGLNVWRAQHAGTRGPSSHHNWLLPVSLLCVSVGGLVGGRRPGVQRVLIGVALVLSVAGLVYAVRG